MCIFILLAITACGAESVVELGHVLYTERGAMIEVYNSTSDEVIDSTKKYIEKRGIDSVEYQYYFVNSENTQVLDFTYCPVDIRQGEDGEFLYYYVVQEYKDADTGGCFTVDLDGNVCEVSTLLDDSILSSVDMNVGFDEYEALEKLNNIIKTDYSYEDILLPRIQIKKTLEGQYVCCYHFELGNNNDVYIDAINGLIVNTDNY